MDNPMPRFADSDDFLECVKKLFKTLPNNSGFQSGMGALMCFNEEPVGGSPDRFAEFATLVEGVCTLVENDIQNASPTLCEGWTLDRRDDPHITLDCVIDPVWRQPVPSENDDDRRLTFRALLSKFYQLVFDTGIVPFTLRFNTIQINSEGLVVLKTSSEDGITEPARTIRRIERIASKGYRYGDGPNVWSVIGRFMPRDGRNRDFPFADVLRELSDSGLFATCDRVGGNLELSEPIGEVRIDSFYFVDFRSREIRPPQDIVRLARIDLPRTAGTDAGLTMIYPENETLELKTIGKKTP